MLSVRFISAAGVAKTIGVKAGISAQEAATWNDIPGIDADCGGGCSCATCHVFVDEAWLERVGSPGTLEAVLLSGLGNAAPNSRLSCQIKLTEALDGLVLRTPAQQAGA